MTRIGALAVIALTLGACNDVIDLDPIDETPPVEASVRPSPIIGGTLTLTSGGMAVASDPDRDVIHVVDVGARQLRHTITLQPGDQPGRVILGAEGRAHVILRGSGALATIDPAAGTVVDRRELCPEIRGAAFDEGDGGLYVACAGGSLIHLDQAGEEVERFELEPDLRDVLIVGGEVKVSTFRSAAILGLDGSRIELLENEEFAPHVAWRTFVGPDGELAVLHQTASKKPVKVNPDPDDLPPDGSPYGGGGMCEMGLVNTALTTISGGYPTTTTFLDSRLTVDAAISPDGEWVAMAVPGAVKPEPPSESTSKHGRRVETFEDFGFVDSGFGSTIRIEPRHEEGCFSGVPVDVGDAQITAIAFDLEARLVIQSREPAQILVLEDIFAGSVDVIDLGGEPRFDSGHEIFHRATDSGLSCASCHPEGGDDGHVWEFDEIGVRRTQPLDVGLADTAPFHWDGDMADVNVLMGEVLAHRMGGKRQSPARADSFTRWLFGQQRPAAAGAGVLRVPEVEADGEAIFIAYGCATCHDGPALGGQKTETIAGVAKQVPTLRRISLHPPFMHDGRSPTLEAAIRDMVETTRNTTASEAEVEAMAAYLRAL
ncbi:MAG: c-type cytochrome [Myxococcales bacterium]|nr:c-type cytochrome [Myxococcales bacterium]MCB9700495.1 c-type cytochrome [Myxococcales bacterium]